MNGWLDGVWTGHCGEREGERGGSESDGEKVGWVEPRDDARYVESGVDIKLGAT